MLIPKLVRQWGMPDEAAGRTLAIRSAIAMCRWRHLMPAIDDAPILANTLVMMRSNTRSVRHLGRSSQSAAARRGELGLLTQGGYGRWTFDIDPARPHEMFHLYLPADYLAELAEHAGTGGRTELRDQIRLSDRTLQLLMRSMDAALDSAQVDRLFVEGLAIAVAARLLSAHSTGAPLRQERGGLSPWQLKRACEAMDAHLDEDIGLHMLAGIAGCSPTHFSRAFKQSTGMPPFQWLLERRIERAQALLTVAGMPLAEVALAVGFAAQPQFTTAFRRVTGVTPGVWRRERML